jgi:hypothetical protein
MQARALRLLADRIPGTVRTGRDIHAAVAEALVGKGLARRGREPGGSRILHITAAGRREIQPLSGEG